MSLSLKEICALHDLANKADGEEADWINQADGQALAANGLAERGRQGWTITAEGLAMVLAERADHSGKHARMAVQRPPL